MMQSLYTAATGISGQQTRIDTIADNIANINSTGFKSSRTSFKDTIYSKMENPEETGQASNLQKGTGVSPAATDKNFKQGNIEATGNKLDFAIDGSGFFSLLNSKGETVYTRNGSFSVSAEEDGNYLTSSDGSYVLDNNGLKIEIPDGTSGFTVAGDGSFVSGDGTTVKLGVFEFPNTEGLASLGDSKFAATAASGDAVQAEDFTVCQGELEGSNVDLSVELTQLIQAQRMYSFASQALQTADEMEGLAINIRS
ncbi:MAG: flagellar hook-basal body protein [Oscillospiraceae bacterium]